MVNSLGFFPVEDGWLEQLVALRPVGVLLEAHRDDRRYQIGKLKSDVLSLRDSKMGHVYDPVQLAANLAATEEIGDRGGVLRIRAVVAIIKDDLRHLVIVADAHADVDALEQVAERPVERGYIVALELVGPFFEADRAEHRQLGLLDMANHVFDQGEVLGMSVRRPHLEGVILQQIGPLHFLLPGVIVAEMLHFQAENFLRDPVDVRFRYTEPAEGSKR